MFGKEDFAGDNIIKLSVVCMPKIGKQPLFPYKSLMKHEQKKFNVAMNEYIQTLGEKWEEKLQKDFNEITNDEIFNEQFDPTKFTPALLNTEPVNIPKGDCVYPYTESQQLPNLPQRPPSPPTVPLEIVEDSPPMFDERA